MKEIEKQELTALIKSNNNEIALSYLDKMDTENEPENEMNPVIKKALENIEPKKQ